MAKNTRPDRFGNEYTVVKCKENKGGFPVGYIEIGGSLYKLEPSEARKDGVRMWIRVTKLKKRTSGGF